MRLTVTRGVDAVQLEVNGSIITPGSFDVSVDPGLNTIVIVASLDGESRTYTLRVNRYGPEIRIVGPATFSGTDEDIASGTEIDFEIIAYEDYVGNKGEQGAKEAGKWRLEGKEYIVQDGDVVHFRFNV